MTQFSALRKLPHALGACWKCNLQQIVFNRGLVFSYRLFPKKLVLATFAHVPIAIFVKLIFREVVSRLTVVLNTVVSFISLLDPRVIDEVFQVIRHRVDKLERDLRHSR